MRAVQSLIKGVQDWEATFRVMQPRVRALGGAKSKNTPRIDISFRELCDKGRHLHLTSWLWILVFSRYFRRLQREFGQMSPTLPDRWVKPCRTSTQISLKHMHRTTIEYYHSRNPELIRLRIWISLSKCSLTTYGMIIEVAKDWCLCSALALLLTACLVFCPCSKSVCTLPSNFVFNWHR